jgi:hypothetical protein
MTKRKKKERDKLKRDRHSASIQPKTAESRNDQKAYGRESCMQLPMANRVPMKHLHAINKHSLHVSYC